MHRDAARGATGVEWIRAVRSQTESEVDPLVRKGLRVVESNAAHLVQKKIEVR
jgi:hypothetical protein